MSGEADAGAAILAQLAQETRDDVKKLLEKTSALDARMSGLETRLASLEAGQGPQASKMRDAGLVTAAGTLVAGILAALQAFGVIPAAPPRPPVQVVAAPAASASAPQPPSNAQAP